MIYLIQSDLNPKGNNMLHSYFLWKSIISIHTIALAIWIGSLFFHAFCLPSCLKLLDQTQRNSVQLQSLQKLFSLNWITIFLSVVCQAFLSSLYPINASIWINYIPLALIILMTLLQVYTFVKPYQQVRRAIRPKSTQFEKIYNYFKLIVVLGLISIIFSSL